VRGLSSARQEIFYLPGRVHGPGGLAGPGLHNVDQRGQILNLAIYVVGEGVTALATTAAAVVHHHEVCSERLGLARSPRGAAFDQ
jgi:hypothetical protein